MKAVILYDPGGPHWDKKDVAQVAESAEDIRDCLKAKGFQVQLLPIRLGDVSWIPKARRADVIFNLCEGLDGHSKYEDYVVGTLELIGVPYTGCRQWPVTICHRKHIANTLMEAAGVPIPRSVVAHSNSRIPMDFPLPAIVKPAAEDASLGIDAGAVCTSRRSLKKRLAEQLEDVVSVRHDVTHDPVEAVPPAAGLQEALLVRDVLHVDLEGVGVHLIELGQDSKTHGVSSVPSFRRETASMAARTF